MKKILFDEAMGDATIIADLLRDFGHEVQLIFISHRGIADVQVLHKANEEGATIVTRDKDFGDMRIRDNQDIPFGVIIIREGKEKVPRDNAFIDRKLANFIHTIVEQQDLTNAVVSCDYKNPYSSNMMTRIRKGKNQNEVKTGLMYVEEQLFPTESLEFTSTPNEDENG